MQSALNYAEMVTKRPAVASSKNFTAVDRVVLTEREAVMCSALDIAATEVAAKSTSSGNEEGAACQYPKCRHNVVNAMSTACAVSLDHDFVN